MSGPTDADRQTAHVVHAAWLADQTDASLIDAIAQALADEREKALRPVLELCAAADQRVRLAVPASAAERLITSGTHTVQVGDLRRAAAAAGPTHEGEQA